MGKQARLRKIGKLTQKQIPASQSHPGSKIIATLQKFVLPFLFFSVFVIGTVLRINNLGNVTVRSPDERIYTFQAKIIAQQGTEGIKILIKEYNSNKELWIYPPPTRLGYLWLLAGVMKMTNRLDENVGAYISCAFSIISLLLLIVIGVRFFNPWIALYGLLFLSVSPMELAIARRTWQDAMLGCIGLFLVYFCGEIIRNSRKITWYILLLVVGSYCLLVKESAAAIYGLCILWLFWILLIKERSFLKGFLLIIFSILAATLSFFVIAQSAGGIAPVIEVFKHVKEAMPTNTYAIEYQSGPWYYFLQGFWIISPLNAFLCLVGIAGIILSSASNKGLYRRAIFGIVFFMIAFMAIAIVIPYCQNLRYVSVLFVPFYLIGGLGLWYVFSFVKVMLKESFYTLIAPIAMIIILVAASDYQNFKKIFVETGILDVSIRMVREYSR